MQYIRNLEVDMQNAFPTAEVAWYEEGNLDLHYAFPDQTFVSILVDWTCWDKPEDFVAVHVRPEDIFLGDVASDAVLFFGYETDSANEFPDDLGHLMWSMHYPSEAHRLHDVAVTLARIAAARAW